LAAWLRGDTLIGRISVFDDGSATRENAERVTFGCIDLSSLATIFAGPRKPLKADSLEKKKQSRYF